MFATTRRYFLLFPTGILASGADDRISDDRLYDLVRMRLAEDTAVNGGALEVDVKEGVVTLQGKVRTEKSRQRAEKITKKVKGVRSVRNLLKVDPSGH